MARKHPTPRRGHKVRARFEDIAFLGRHGATSQEVAERLGISMKTMLKSIDRHQAWPLLERLRRNEVERFGFTLAELGHINNGGAKRRLDEAA